MFSLTVCAHPPVGFTGSLGVKNLVWSQTELGEFQLHDQLGEFRKVR